MRSEHVVIVGGGFSGSLLAINLVRHDAVRVTLIERVPERLARGVAYSAAGQCHLLNVRAANMSALPDDPQHFVRWLTARDLGDGGSFVARAVYGRYLGDLLDDARETAGARLAIRTGDVVAVRPGPSSVTIKLAGGSIDADRVVLALGNLPPHAPPGIDAAALSQEQYVADPWSGDWTTGLAADAPVVLLGTGLTAIDVALTLDQTGHRGPIVALSRRGLSPRAHADGQPPAHPRDEKPARALSAMVRAVRDTAADRGWRGAVDGLRPVTQLLWSGADAATRARFLRHLRPWWDVHRHRLSPQVAGRIATMVDRGQLRFVAGKLVAIDPGGTVAWRARGTDRIDRHPASRIVNCTGPQGDLLRSNEPLLRDLVARGLARPDPLRLGLDVDAATQLIGRDGTAQPRIHAIGPMTRGAWWEVVAVPDLRVQAWRLARALTNAHWVGGEGL